MYRTSLVKYAVAGVSRCRSACAEMALDWTGAGIGYGLRLPVMDLDEGMIADSPFEATANSTGAGEVLDLANR